MKMLEEKLKIDKISKGSVIDHIDAGYALTILNLTGIDESKNLITIGVNVSSKKYATKDIIKIENVFLNKTQMQQKGCKAYLESGEVWSWDYPLIFVLCCI